MAFPVSTWGRQSSLVRIVNAPALIKATGRGLLLVQVVNLGYTVYEQIIISVGVKIHRAYNVGRV